MATLAEQGEEVGEGTEHELAVLAVGGGELVDAFEERALAIAAAAAAPTLAASTPPQALRTAGHRSGGEPLGSL